MEPQVNGLTSSIPGFATWWRFSILESRILQVNRTHQIKKQTIEERLVGAEVERREWNRCVCRSHHLFLGHARSFGVHGVRIRIDVSNESEAKWTATILVAGELC
jgi:hypothetical protein